MTMATPAALDTDARVEWTVCSGRDTWATVSAAQEGDTAQLAELLDARRASTR